MGVPLSLFHPLRSTSAAVALGDSDMAGRFLDVAEQVLSLNLHPDDPRV